MISLDLNRAGKAADASSLSFTDLIEMLRTIIRGIALHAIESQPAHFARLQQDMCKVADSLRPESSGDEIMVAITEVLRISDDYNRNATGFFKSQLEELHTMLAKMTETMQFIASSSETSTKQLSFMELQLKKASGLEDLRQLRTYTAACLSLVRKETTRLQVETHAKVNSLKKDVEVLSTRLHIANIEASEDPVTGLPGRVAAEHAIKAKMAGKPFAVALFLMDRLASINGRFGHSVGDDVVITCAHMLAKTLTGATLYRWSGPGFLAVFDPSVSALEAETRARLAASQQLERNIEVDQRMLLIVVAVSCHVQQVSSATTLSELFRTMDGIMMAGQN